MSFANKLRETANNSVDRDAANKIVEVLLKKAEDEAKRGNFECCIHVYHSDVGLTESSYLSRYFHWNKYSNNSALGLLVKSKLQANGLRIVERVGVNGLYGVITW
jgi:hypothetical protein